MASIFLSYAREDAGKAKTLAKALERAGHDVWWDRNIGGGAEFSGEIEAALSNAEIVLVLWSDAAVRSAWVRDEAAEGRDSGRLLPVQLDSTPAPLGFRQLQAISLAGWSGRGSPSHVQDILKAIDRRSDKPTQPVGQRAAPSRQWARVVLAGLGVLLLALGAWWVVKERGGASDQPVLAVLPFSDLSPGRDRAYFAEGVAEAILTVLAKEPGITVLGRSTARQLHDAGGNARGMRKALGVTHLLEGSSRSVGDQLRMSVRLVDAKDGQQLWAEEYRRRLDNVFDIQDEIGRAVALKLRGSLGSLASSTAPATNADAYTLYLAARAKMRDRETSAMRDALETARRAIAADPKYAPAHAIYAELIEMQSYDNYGTLSPDRVKQLALPHARRAIQLAPNSAEGYAALGMILSGAEAIAPLRKAIQLDPARAELRGWLAAAFHIVGKNEAALREIEAGAAMDPLSPPIFMGHVFVLAASGRLDEAEAVIRNYEERGGSRARAAKMRGDIAGWSGDISEAIRLNRLALKADPEIPLINASLAWFYSVAGLTEQAAAAAKSVPPATQIYLTGDYASLVEIGRREGRAIWKRPDHDLIVDAFAIRRDWATITHLYDTYPPSLDLVCADNRTWIIQLGLNFAQAFKEQGRGGVSEKFLRCVKANLAKTGAGMIRTPYMSNAMLALLRAQVMALEGRPDQALTLLESAIQKGFRAKYRTGLAHLPAFDSLRSDPRYQRLDGQLKQLAAAERAQVLRLPPA